MTHRECVLKMPEMAALLAVEQEILPENEKLRERVLLRARGALTAAPSVPGPVRFQKSRQLRIGVSTFAAVMVSGLFAAAFYAGYQARSSSFESPVRTPKVSVGSVPIPVQSSSVAVAALAPSTPERSKSVEAARSFRPEILTQAERSTKVAEVDSYGMELKVLQPARQALARRDFASAIGAITQHQRQFPSGRLVEEREALRVKSLLGLGRVAEAQRVGATFRARFPRSVLLHRIDEMLGPQP